MLTLLDIIKTLSVGALTALQVSVGAFLIALLGAIGTLPALKAAVRAGNPKLAEFEASCFDGKYITGDVTADYLSHLAEERDASRGEDDEDMLEAAESGAARG